MFYKLKTRKEIGVQIENIFGQEDIVHFGAITPFRQRIQISHRLIRQGAKLNPSQHKSNLQQMILIMFR